MKKIVTKKLTLNRESLRLLDEKGMKEAAGGQLVPYTAYYSNCPDC
jgi:hypothetical protein